LCVAPGGSSNSAGTTSPGYCAPRTACFGQPGSPGGQAIKLNANSVTWGATGTVYGSVA
jgi:hypothetical protein